MLKKVGVFFQKAIKSIKDNFAGFFFVGSSLVIVLALLVFEYLTYRSYFDKIIKDKRKILANILQEKSYEFKLLEDYFLQNLKIDKLLEENSDRLNQLSSKRLPAFHNNFFYFIYDKKGNIKSLRLPERISEAFLEDTNFISITRNVVKFKGDKEILMWLSQEGPVQLYFKAITRNKIEAEPSGYLLLGLVWDKNFRNYIENNLNADIKLIPLKNFNDYDSDFFEIVESAFDSQPIALIVKLKDNYAIDFSSLVVKYVVILFIFFVFAFLFALYERKKIYYPLRELAKSVSNKSFQGKGKFSESHRIINELAENLERLLNELNEISISDKRSKKELFNYEKKLKKAIEELESKNTQLNKIKKLLETDFTNYKLNAISQKSAEQKIKTFFEDAPVSYLILDQNGVILEFNKRWQAYVQYEEKDIRNVKLSSFLTTQSAVHFENSLEYFSQLNYLYCDLEIVSRKGSILEAKFFGRSQKEEGDLRIYSIIVDMTETRAAIKKLEEKERYLSDIIKNAPEAILIFDKEGVIIDANPEAENLLKMSKSSLIGMSYDSPDWNYRDLDNNPLDKTQTPFYICKKELQPIKDIFFSIKNGKGKTIYLKVRAVPLFNSNRVFNGILVSMIDVTDKTLNELELKKTNEQLREMYENSNKMIRILSHDLRSPFVGILGLTEILATEAENFDYANIKRLCSELNVTLKKQYKLIDNLLNWARLKSGRIDYNIREIDVAELVKETINYYNLNLKQKDIRVNLHIEEKSTAFVDENVTLLAINNIISNAIKYSPKEKTINIFIKNSEDKIQITIQDNGIGMSPNKIQELMTSEFVSSEPGVNKEKGTGIGFSIARDFIKAQGGTIEIKSEINKGTTVTITLPKKKSKSFISQL